MSAGPVTKSDAAWRLAVRPALITQFVLYLGGYAALLGWFKSVDVYHLHFADTGALILVHNLFRILFVFYLFWMVQAAGAVLLRLIGRLRPQQVGMAGYLAVTFFAGAGVWQVVLFAVGYAGLLNAPIMIVLATPMVAASFGEVRAAIPALHMSLARLWQSGALAKSLVVLLFLSWAALLIVKGLYPGNGIYYYEPYLQTYKAFLVEGSLWPHAAWWFSFYCQGAGLFFLGMLLTDAMAVQLVTFCLVSVAGLTTLLFIRHLTPRSHWPLAGAVLLFATFVYTPGWAEFRKLHEFNTAFVVAILWMTTMALAAAGPARKIWWCAAASTLIAAIIASNYIGVFLGVVFAVLALAYFALGERARAFACFGLAALGGFLVADTLAINYLVYGLFNGWDPTLTLLWQFADVEKVYRMGALPTVVDILNSVSHSNAARVHIAWAEFLIRALRLEIFWPLVLGGGLVAAIALRDRFSDGKASGRHVPDAALVLSVALAVYVLLALVVGRSDASTFYRFSSFTVPIVIVAGIALWTATPRPRATLLRWFAGPAGPIAVLLLCGAMLVGKTRFDPGVPRLAVHALEYTIGAISIDDAYTQPSEGGFTVPWADIYPGVRGVYAVVGPHTPVLSLNFHTFCELPDCRIMWSATSILVPGIEQVLWGTPEKARATLQKAGLDFFLVSRATPLAYGPLLASPLFSPDNIGKIFGVRWTDGATTLLTWAGPATFAIDEKWLAGYRSQLAESRSRLATARGRTDELTAVFDRLRTLPHPWHPSDVPRRQAGWPNVPEQ